MTEIFEKMRCDMEGLPQHRFFLPKDGQPRYPIGWDNLMEGSYSEQSAQLLSVSKIDSICQGIRDYLNRLTNAYDDAKSVIDAHPSSTL